MPSRPPARSPSPVERGIFGWVFAHWLALVNGFLTFYIAGAAAPPLLIETGQPRLAATLFGLYGFVCHQLPGRSFFLFGHQMGFCHRDVAIFGTILLGGLLFSLIRLRLRALPWQLYLALCVPMAIDGGTQLLGWRESTWELRVITGFLFGLATVWSLYPIIDRGMRQAAMDYEAEGRARAESEA